MEYSSMKMHDLITKPKDTEVFLKGHLHNPWTDSYNHHLQVNLYGALVKFQNEGLLWPCPYMHIKFCKLVANKFKIVFIWTQTPYDDVMTNHDYCYSNISIPLVSSTFVIPCTWHWGAPASGRLLDISRPVNIQFRFRYLNAAVMFC